MGGGDEPREKSQKPSRVEKVLAAGRVSRMRPLELQIVGRTLGHAALVGLAAGFVGTVFVAALDLVQRLVLENFVGYLPLLASGEEVLPSTDAPKFRWWLLLFIPALGALISGIISGRLAPETQGGGADAIIRAFHEQGGLVRRRVAWVKGIASIFTLGFGGSGGREGPTMQTDAPRRTAAPKNLAIPGISRIIAVASGKGGVGKSTTAVNLALGLVASGWRVGLLDADVFGPSLPRLLGLDTKPELEGKMLKPLYVFGLKAMSIGFLVAEGEAMIWRGPMVMSAINQLLREVDWGELDCLVVDMPPGTGDAQLTLAQSVPLAGAVIVSTPQDLALIDARRGVTMFQKTSVPILGIVENMSYFICPHCHGRSDIFAHGGARHEAETLGVPFLGEVPLTLQIREQSDAGRPPVAVSPDSAAGQAYRAIAGRVRAGLEGACQRQAPRIVVE